MNQLKNSIAIAVSYFAQWFWAHSLKSFPMRILVLAYAQAIEKVNVAVTCNSEFSNAFFMRELVNPIGIMDPLPSSVNFSLPHQLQQKY